MIYDEAWLRGRGFELIGDRALRRPPQESRAQDRGGAGTVPEATLLSQVRRCARELGYLTYHTRDARGSDCGFPDLCLVRPASATQSGRLIFAELKSARGKVTREQQLWLSLLAHLVPGIEVALWRPADWSAIQALLRRP
jgi:hypothetical protein